jgi:uncharacterized alpha/beta hydrolase family protein
MIDDCLSMLEIIVRPIFDWFDFKEKRYQKHKKIISELCKKYVIEQVDDCDWKYKINKNAEDYSFIQLDRKYGLFSIATKWEWKEFKRDITYMGFHFNNSKFLNCEYEDFRTTNKKKIEKIITKSLLSLKQADVNFKLKNMEKDFE